MCVVAIVKEKKHAPSLELLQKMENSNPDGGGIAWIKGDYVYFKKGLNYEQINEIQNSIQSPYVIHFRIASIGGKSEKLTHPFLISKSVPLLMEGKTKTGVIFHNGHLTNWRSLALQVCASKGIKFPDFQLLSDTRIMAWIAYHVGINALSLLDEKIVAVTPKKIRIFGSGWQDDDGLVVSNKNYKIEVQRCSYLKSYKKDKDYYGYNFD